MYFYRLLQVLGEAFKMNPFGGITGDKLIVAQIIEKCTDFCGTQKFVFVSKRVRHLSLFRTS